MFGYAVHYGHEDQLLPPSGHSRDDRHPRDDRDAAALAVVLDDPQRQPSARQPRRAEGRRAPGELRVDHRDHGRALFRRAPAAGPGRGEAACRTGAPRDPLSARPAETWTQLQRYRGHGRRAELSEPHQGRDPGRFLDRLGRPRRRDHRLCQPGPGLSDRAWPDGRGRCGPDDRVDGRCRARRGQYLRMPDRGL